MLREDDAVTEDLLEEGPATLDVASGERRLLSAGKLLVRLLSTVALAGVIALSVRSAGGIHAAWLPGHALLARRTELLAARSVVPAGAVNNTAVTSRTLTTLDILGTIVIDEDGHSQTWPILSAVPVLRQRDAKVPQLAVILPLDLHGRSHTLSPTGACNRSVSHYARFPSGSISKFRKFCGLGEQSVATWYADLPDGDASLWFSANGSHPSCLTFRMLNASQMVVSTLRSCHNPSAFAPEERPYNLTLCHTVLPLTIKGKEQYSGRLKLLPNIMYHIRHGADQTVLYVGYNEYKFFAQLLMPFIERKLVTLVLVRYDVRASGSHVYVLSFANENKQSYTGYVQFWLDNDCLNRFKGRTKYLGLHDYDEYLRPVAWSNDPTWASRGLSLVDAIDATFSPHCKWLSEPEGSWGWEVLGSKNIGSLGGETSQGECDGDFLHPPWEYWTPPQDFKRKYLIDTTQRKGRPTTLQMGKSLLRPENIAIAWVHFPEACFGRRCRLVLNQTGLVWAHVRPKSKYPDHHFHKDLFFSNETALVRQQLCDWFKKVGSGCADPITWLKGQR
mmetsp:Transcript_21672/g.47345  ORF Transcript_21672/g.47345 Transcript_21672/m.47345 type:complete len:561 (-) Transcript_21672:93-1775(-)